MKLRTIIAGLSVGLMGTFVNGEHKEVKIIRERPVKVLAKVTVEKPMKMTKQEEIKVEELKGNDIGNIIKDLDGKVKDQTFTKTMKMTKKGIIVGYNYNISKNGITEEAASLFVEKEVATKREELNKYSWFRKLDRVRQGAVINLTFNLGTGGFFKFKRFLSHLKKGQYESAGKSLLYTSSGRKTKYYSQVKGRAKDIADQIRTGRAKENVVATLKRHEGFRKYPYKDTRGIWTVGYGINLEGRGLEKDEALMVMAYAKLDKKAKREKA